MSDTRKRSKIWNHFNFIDNTKAVCRVQAKKAKAPENCPLISAIPFTRRSEVLSLLLQGVPLSAVAVIGGVSSCVDSGVLGSGVCAEPVFQVSDLPLQVFPTSHHWLRHPKSPFVLLQTPQKYSKLLTQVYFLKHLSIKVPVRAVFLCLYGVKIKGDSVWSVKPRVNVTVQ